MEQCATSLLIAYPMSHRALCLQLPSYSRSKWPPARHFPGGKAPARGHEADYSTQRARPETLGADWMPADDWRLRSPVGAEQRPLSQSGSSSERRQQVPERGFLAPVTMLPTKVETEKQDLETTSARSRLDAVLQCLLEKSDVDREQMDEDVGKTPSDPLSKDSSPSATGKRPSARFSHHRRKKRKETDDSLTEGSQQRQNTYIIKLFDRSVDLAQFAESTPLYPICRAWMRNSPTVRERERSPSPPLPALPEDEEGAEGLNGKSQDVYKLPPPCASPESTGREAVSARIPSPLPPEEGGPRLDTPAGPLPSMSSLIYRNMERWKKTRQRWKEASHRNQLRYAESMKILKEMYERQ